MISGNYLMKLKFIYIFFIFYEEWKFDINYIMDVWDNKGNIIIGNDVWIGYDFIIMLGVNIGDGVIIGIRVVVINDVLLYFIVGGVFVKIIKKRFNNDIILKLLEIKWWDWLYKKI